MSAAAMAASSAREMVLVIKRCLLGLRNGIRLSKGGIHVIRLSKGWWAGCQNMTLTHTGASLKNMLD
jgi:hypothetical protein